MRCQACDCELSDHETSRKDSHGKYLDLCSTCFFTVRNEMTTHSIKSLVNSKELEDDSST
jgi:Zn-finger protein